MTRNPIPSPAILALRTLPELLEMDRQQGTALSACNPTEQPEEARLLLRGRKAIRDQINRRCASH